MRFHPAEGFIILGKILRPHGIRGWLRILSFASGPEVFERAGNLYTIGETDVQEYKVEAARPFKKMVILKLEGIEDRSQAELLRGKELYVRKDSLPKEEGEYFWFELIGLKVIDQESQTLGIVEELMRTQAHDILVVNDGNRSIYIPMVEGIIQQICPEEGHIRVMVIEGMLDINEG